MAWVAGRDRATVARVRDEELSPPIESPVEPDTFALSTAVYAEGQDGRILLLKRAEGSAMAGTYFLPGGMVDPGETPWEAAARELREESGLEFSAPPQMVGCYPMFVYGRDFLQLTFRGPVAGDVSTSHEHTDHRWVDPGEWSGLFTEDGIEAIAGGHPKITALIRAIGDDLARYLAIVDGPRGPR